MQSDRHGKSTSTKGGCSKQNRSHPRTQQCLFPGPSSKHMFRGKQRCDEQLCGPRTKSALQPPQRIPSKRQLLPARQRHIGRQRQERSRNRKASRILIVCVCQEHSYTRSKEWQRQPSQEGCGEARQTPANKLRSDVVKPQPLPSHKKCSQQ